ncbi:MAG: class II aldolase/adducin family protein [Oscillospiraceae bacterium]|nr:class II aldolase/adducin family protein [Oscillospiraceae bacterium]
MNSYLSDQQAKQALIAIGAALYTSGLNVGTDGNFSYLVGENALWTTASGSAKGQLREADLVKTDLCGAVLAGSASPSSELKLHLAVYRVNPLAKAVIHVHSVAATALACTGIAMDKPLLPPVVMQLGKVCIAPYADPGSQALADSILPFAKENNAVLLANHGAAVWGRTLQEAFSRTQTLEQCAKITLEAQKIGTPQYLTAQQSRQLHEIGCRLGNFQA